MCAVTGETDTDTASAPAATVGRRQTRSELPPAKFRAPSAGGTAGVLVGWSAGGWCRRCAATERVTHLDLGQDWAFHYRFLLQAVLIRMRVVMDPRSCRLLGFRG